MPLAERSGSHIAVKTEYAENEGMKQIPGANWKAGPQVWQLPLALTSCFALRGRYGDRLQVGPELTAWSQGEFDRWLLAARWLALPGNLVLPPSDRCGPSTLHDALAQMEAMRTEPTEFAEAAGFPAHPALRGFQEVATAHMVLAERSILASDVGAGKTPTTIMAIELAERLHDTASAFPVLLVCPSGLKRNWANEFAKWMPNRRVSVVTGTPAKRRKAVQRIADGDAEVLIIGYEAVRSFSRLAPYGSIRLRRCDPCGGVEDIKPGSCEVHPRELNHVRWGTVACDEAHRLKDPTAKTTRAVWWASRDARYRWALTGTPIANSLVDLWSLLHFINPEEWPTRVGFIDRYVETSPGFWGGIEIIGINAHTNAELRQTLDARMLRQIKAEVLPDLPPKLHQIRTCELSRPERKAYDEMKKGLLAEVEGGQVIGWNPLVQVGRLVQMANSSVLVTPGLPDPVTGVIKDDVVPCEPSTKLDLLMDTLQDFTANPVVVFFNSRKLLLLAEARLAKAKPKPTYACIHGGVNESDRATAVQKLQAGDLAVLLVTVGAGGEGITLSRADTMIFVQRPWSLIQNVQCEGRCHRIGSEIHESINIIDLVAEDTVDSHVIDVVTGKAESMEEVVRDKDRLRMLLR